VRGQFNKTCAFVYGPRSPFGVPGTVRLSPVPCRKVEQVEITQMQPPYDLSMYWATFDLVVPNVPITYTPFIGITYEDWCQADVIVFLDDTEVGFLAVRAEQIVPDEGGAYWRTLLVPLAALEVPPWPPLAPLPPLPPSPPPPPSPPTPGVECASPGELVLDADYEGPYSVSGGSSTSGGHYWFCPVVPGNYDVYIELVSGAGGYWRNGTGCPGDDPNYFSDSFVQPMSLLMTDTGVYFSLKGNPDLEYRIKFVSG